jgi:hypothetical protein
VRIVYVFVYVRAVCVYVRAVCVHAVCVCVCVRERLYLFLSE